MSLFEELKRRNVFRVGIAYGVASWLLIQMSDILVPLLGLQESVQKIILLLLAIGLIPALIMAWAFEMTPEGIKKEKDVDRSQSVTSQTGRKLDRTIIIVLALAVGFLLYRQVGMGPAEEAPIEPPAIVAVEAAASIIKSVAVLPFVNMSSDPEQEYFSDGLSEELLNRLAKNDQLHVAARTSSFQFKGQTLDIADIGRQLNVANVLEGSVRKAGNRLRITAQLIQVDNGFHLWSETYEREMDDIFAIQDEISLAISQALEIELGTGADSNVSQKPTTNLEAYNHYLQARFLLAQRGGENMAKADELFAKAVALDPDFTEAWSGKAFNVSLLWGYSDAINLDESIAKTLLAAQQAIELNPDNAEAYTAIGRALGDNMQWIEARTNLERAYELGPNDVGVNNLYGDFLGLNLGDFDRAISLEQKAISLDPLSGVHASDLADLLMIKGQYDDALTSARRGVRLAPNSLARIHSLVFSLVTTDKFEEAASLLDQLSASWTSNSRFEGRMEQWWAFYYYRKGELENLRKLIAEKIQANEANPKANRGLGYAQIAFYSLNWDHPDNVVPWLEKALVDKEGDLIYPAFFYLPERISNDPGWLAFWNKPELKELLDIRRENPYPTNGLWISHTVSDQPNP